MNRLSKKEKGFANDWLELGNATKAALKNYDTKSENTAAAIGSQNLRKRKIIDYLDSHSAGASLRIVKISKTAKNETVKLNANKDILDRAGFKPLEKKDITSGGKPIPILNLNNEILSNGGNPKDNSNEEED